LTAYLLIIFPPRENCVAFKINMLLKDYKNTTNDIDMVSLSVKIQFIFVVSI
jgi:hypothetical protein